MRGHSDANFQDKCLQTLKKLTELESEVSQKLQNVASDNQKSVLASPPTTSSSSSLKAHPEFPDAEMVIRGRDGKKMFFKKRFRGEISTSDKGGSSIELPRVTALVVPHPPPEPEKNLLATSTVSRQRRISQGLSRQQWPASLLLLTTRIQRQLAIVRVDEDDEVDALVISVYSSVTSQISTLAIPFSSLGFVLPTPLDWSRISEVSRFADVRAQAFTRQSAHPWFHYDVQVQRCKQVEEHWRCCFPRILSCLRWKAVSPPAAAELELRFPIQFRQGKIFAFRTYESFPGLLSVRLSSDFSLIVEFVSVRKPEKLSLHVPERNLVMLWSDYRERLRNKVSR